MMIATEACFKVGDIVWHATFESREKWVTCPHCKGYKFATVTFGDGETVTVDCAECAPGYQEPRGIVKIYEHSALAKPVEVVGVHIDKCNNDGIYEVRYSLSDYRSGDETDCFTDESHAMSRSAELAVEWNQSELRRIGRKDKPSATWSSNASYHRSCIKRAQHDLEYHTRKLEAAKSYAKKEKSDEPMA